MRILFLTPGCFDKGGISRYSRYQIKALQEIFGKENIRVLSLLGPGQDSFEEEFNVEWYAGGNEMPQKSRFVFKTLRQMIRWRPDVIQVAHVNLSGFAFFLAKFFKIKTVLNVYGLEVWSGLSADAAYGLRHANYVISDCNYTAAYIEQMKFRDTGSTTVIWDCVDIEKFYPAEPNPEIRNKYGVPSTKDHFVILSLGRLSKTASHKGYERLIKVFLLLSKKYDKVRLVIAGKGDNKSFYEALVKKYSITDKVTFTGMVDEKDLPDIYRCASVFSLVSDRGRGRGEGIPLTPLEAMACGIPVIVGNQDGSREAVIDNLNGIVIDPYDTEQHVSAIEALLTSNQLWTAKSKAATQLSQVHFSFIIFKNKLLAFYSGLS